MREPADELIPTRASLLHRLKDGRDETSWRQFFETYWKLIYTIARRAGLDDSEAQDVVQETMLAVFRHMPGFKYDASNGSFKAWLLNMTRWRIIDCARKRKQAAVEAPFPADQGTDTGVMERFIDPAGNALDALWEAEWQQTVLEAAVARVKRRVEPESYQLFDFYVNQDWPAEKVASSFNVPLGRVYLAKHRVSGMLKEEAARIEKEGV
jgi:RNA polymerase sigma-70 factor (ECF subfamily)